MQQVILSVHIVLATVLVLLILLQQGKGANAGAAFGAGASGTVFGSSGTGGFLSQATAVFAVLFFATSSYLAYFHARGGSDTTSIIDTLAIEEQEIPDIGPIPDDLDLGNAEMPVLPADSVVPPPPQSEPDKGDE
ncbi:MAG: preprotein translocase subunit SecG [Gammaproteobacteria bacterium]|nr:preprotein translocase subunit SecG [Gammaproteobacteria bacterium]